MNDNWTKDIKRLADNSVRKAPEGLLDDVKSEMQRRGLMLTQPSAKVVPMRRWRYAAAAAVIAVIAGVGITSLHRSEPSGEIASTTQGGSDTHYSNIEQSTSDNIECLTSNQAPTNKPNVIHKVVDQLVSKVEEVSNTNMNVDIADKADKTETTNTTDTKQLADNNPLPSQQHSVGSTRRDLGYVAPRHEGNASWSVGAYYGGTTNNSPTSNTPRLFALSDVNAMSSPVKLDKNSTMTMEEIGDKKESHHQTVKVGISLRYSINDRWSLQTGVTYTRLTSDFSEEKSTTNQTTNQKLDYLGIPLMANHNIWHNKYVNIYASAGGAVEKFISGASTTETKDYTTDKTSRANNDVKENRPVFSTSVAAGVEYCISDFLSIYAQPAITYHFDNGGDLKSLYTDKPLNIELSIGARININK